MATLKAINETASDPALRERMIAAAAEAGIENPSAWVDARSRLIAATEVASGDGQTVADAYVWARDRRREHLAEAQALPPGENEGAVTDDYLRYVVGKLKAGEQGA